MQKRPELESVRQQLANDDTSIKLAHHNLQPDLSLQGFYSVQWTGRQPASIPDTLPPIVISQGGLGDALRQLARLRFPGVWV